MAGCPPAKKEKLRQKFAQLDEDGSGTLDYDELSKLLKKGNPNFDDDEIHGLYTKCDLDGNGVIDFDEFITYIYGQEKTDHAGDRKAGGRHERLANAGGPVHDSTEGDWGPCHAVFNAFAGEDMDNREFAKFCKDADLIKGGLTKTDVDLIFTKIKAKDKRKIDFEGFKKGLLFIAEKKGMAVGALQEKVGSSSGPKFAGTKTEAVKFYDDKSTYTGALAHNEKYGDCGADAKLGRHEKMHAAEEERLANAAGSEEDWGESKRVFDLFAGAGGELDGKEFIKMCSEITGMLGKKYTKQDVDIVFAAAAHGGKKFAFPGFQDAVRRIAIKKGQGVGDVQRIISRSEGPRIVGTKTGQCRFHDDKSSYTGAHAEVHGRADGHGADRHADQHKLQEALEHGDEGENDWTDAMNAFTLYECPDGGVLSKDFLKLCVDSNLFGTGFKKEDIDIVFTQAVKEQANKRKLEPESFKKAIRLIAHKKHQPTHQVQKICADSSGPVMHGTKVIGSRFAEKDNFTGTAANE